MALFSDADKQRIEERVEDVETRTAGEIVVAVVGRSDDYVGPRAIYAATGALLLAVIAHMIWLDVDATWFLAMQLPLGLGLYALTGLAPVVRLMIPGPVRTQAAEQRAVVAFAQQGIFNTRDRTGVLILLSEQEHRAVILGDQGIHERVHTEGWQTHVRHIVEAIRAGRPADGVCQVIDDLGAALADKVPIKHDDTNELPNAVVEEDV